MPSLTEDDLGEFMETADVEKDGVLSFEEFMGAYNALLKKSEEEDKKNPKRSSKNRDDEEVDEDP